MALSLSAVLRHPVVARAAPRWLAARGHDPDVRWVHSSEIYEIAPLLRGGEVLLTTGLGLAGCDQDRRVAYLEGLAERHLAGLFIELGRTLTEMPADLVDAAERLGLPLVALDQVVPFVEITEAVNTLLVDGAVHQLRIADEISRALSAALTRGAGVAELVGLVAAAAGGAALLDASGRTVACAGGLGRHPQQAVVVLAGTAWGLLRVAAGDPTRDETTAVLLDRAPDALALALAREHVTAPIDPAHLLFATLDSPDAAPTAELRRRLLAAGVGLDEAHIVLPVVAEHPQPGVALRVLAQAITAQGWRLCAVDDLLRARALVSVPRARATGAGEELVTGLSTQGRGDPALTVIVGPATRTAAGVARALRAAGRTVDFVRETLGASTIALAESLILDRLVATAPGEVDELLGELLSPVLAWDVAHRSQLLATLEAYLDEGLSKTRTAARLFIGRQTLYQRLARIDALVDRPGTAASVTAYRLAIAAHRLRTG